MRERDTAYAFAVAKVRALSQKLLTREDFFRLTELKDAGSRTAFLTEYGYQGVNEEDMAEAEPRRVYALLREMAPNPELISLLVLPVDYHNLKVMLKSEFLGKSLDELWEKGGRVAVEKIKEKDFSGWSPIMKEGFFRAKKALKMHQNVTKMEHILDQYCYKEMLNLAEKCKSDFAIKLVKTEIDFINLETLLRIQNRGERKAPGTKVFLEGGDILLSLLTEGVEKPFADTLSRTPYRDFLEKTKPVDFSKKHQEYLFDFLESAKYEAFGPAPLFLYFYAKKRELTFLRVLLSDCRRGVAEDVLKERVQEFYA